MSGGGETRELNQHHDSPNQRFALDLLGVGEDGKTQRGDGTRNEDYYAFGREVLAPADGTVMEVIKGVRDNTPGSMNPYSAVGNCVVIQHRKKEVSVLAHLKHGSIVVNVGDNVKRGQLLGNCGNSGNSSEPHLHYHLQNSPVLQDGLGIPCAFQTVVLTKDGQSRNAHPLCASERRNCQPAVIWLASRHAAAFQNRVEPIFRAFVLFAFHCNDSGKGPRLNSTPTDERHFLKLVNENRNKILRVCRVYAWNAADQDDLYQEILFQIWRSLPALQEERFANTWLYRVAINTAISFVRKRASLAGRVVHFEHADLTRTIESQQTAEDNTNDRIADLYTAIYKLGPLEKALVTLFLEGL